MTLSPAFKKRCEQIAVAYRRELGNRQPYDPLPSCKMLEKLEIAVITPETAPGLSPEQRQALYEFSGAIVSLEPRIALCNPAHSATRHESTMMHECAHIILKHPMQPLDLIAPRPPRDPRCEEEATYLGGCLQIPRRGLLWAIQKQMTLEQIAAHFGASTEMVLYRANMTGQRKKF